MAKDPDKALKALAMVIAGMVLLPLLLLGAGMVIGPLVSEGAEELEILRYVVLVLVATEAGAAAILYRSIVQGIRQTEDPEQRARRYTVMIMVLTSVTIAPVLLAAVAAFLTGPDWYVIPPVVFLLVMSYYLVPTESRIRKVLGSPAETAENA